MCNDFNNKPTTHAELMKAVKDVDDNFVTLLQSLLSFRGESDKPINKKDLESYPLFEKIYLSELVTIVRRNNVFGDYLNFDTFLKKGGAFGEHIHNDIIESAEIIKGKMIDKIDGKIYYEGEVMHYDKGQRHEPVALSETKLKVLFKS
jgi:hypothetical protein